MKQVWKSKQWHYNALQILFDDSFQFAIFSSLEHNGSIHWNSTARTNAVDLDLPDPKIII